MTHRCTICRRMLLPWQSRGWRVESRSRTTYWHGTCARSTFWPAGSIVSTTNAAHV